MKDITKKFFKRDVNLVISKINNEAIIFETTSVIYFKTNQVGSFVLNILEKKMSFLEIYEETLNHFDLLSKDCTEDIKDFLTLSLEKNLIEIYDK